VLRMAESPVFLPLEEVWSMLAIKHRCTPRGCKRTVVAAGTAVR